MLFNCVVTGSSSSIESLEPGEEAARDISTLLHVHTIRHSVLH